MIDSRRTEQTEKRQNMSKWIEPPVTMTAKKQGGLFSAASDSIWEIPVMRK